MKPSTEDDRHLPRPSVIQAARFGLALGVTYAALGSVVVLVGGGVPEAWGDATLLTVILVEVCGGLIGGALFGLIARAARYWAGAVLVTPVGLAPLIIGVGVAVEGPTLRTVVAGAIASLLIGAIVGHQLWKSDFRYW